MLLVAGGKGGWMAGAVVGGGRGHDNQRQGPRVHRAKLLLTTAELMTREGHF